MEGRGNTRSSKKYLPTSIKWRIYDTIDGAYSEAADMEKQYYLFVKMKLSASIKEKPHFEKECAIARRYMMDCNSFAISFKRRGYQQALQDLNIKRTIINEEALTQEVEIGTTLNLFPKRPSAQRENAESCWSTLFSR